MGNELHRDRVERATQDTLERVERALRDLGLRYLPLRVRDAIVDGMQWAYRAASRQPSAPHQGHALDGPIKRLPKGLYQHVRAAQQEPVRKKLDHRSAILPPVSTPSGIPNHQTQGRGDRHPPNQNIPHRSAFLPTTPVKRASARPKPDLNQTRRPVYHALPPPSPRARQTTMEIRPEDFIWPDDDAPTDPMIRKPRG